MQAIHLIVMIEVQPGKRDLQIEAYKRLRPLVLAEEGCLQYELFCDAQDDNKFVLLEKWASQAALDTHDAAAHMRAADALNATFRARSATVIKMDSVHA